jgi:hypothetical protein
MSHRTGRRKRRGMSLVLVLGLVAIALALSYALLRTQMTAVQVQGNAARQIDARQAAQAGLSAAIRKMHQADWAGVDTVLQGDLGPNSWYEVGFETGDAALSEQEPDYAEYPFRVTLISTGYAADPARPDARATHRVSAVMQLVRRSLSAEPQNWPELQQHTIYQWANVDAYVQVPVHTAGKVLLQGPLHLCDDAPSYNAAREQFLKDLEKMRVAGLGDDRPFQGPVSLPESRNSPATLNLLRNQLNVTVTGVAATDAQPLTLPGNVASYRLYPGGKLYTVPTIQSQFGASLANLTLASNPKTNPLGVFPSAGALSIKNNVTIEGVLLSSGSGAEVSIEGQNIALRGRDLPALYASNGRQQLPAVIAGEDFRVRSNALGSLTGLAVVGDDFEFQEGSSQTKFDLSGRLVTRSLRLLGRDGWAQPALIWVLLLQQFELQLILPSPIVHFPVWLQTQLQVQVKPLLTIRPDSSGVAYHWQDFSQPVYSAHADDGGLRWDLVRWKDNP